MSSTSLNSQQRDCLQEICNVAMGQAGDLLARDYSVFVTLTIPSIKLIAASELAASLQNFDADNGIYAFSQMFTSADELEGLALVILAEESVEDLSTLLNTSVGDAQEVLLGETCQKLTRVCLDSLGEQCDIAFATAAPVVSGFEAMNEICRSVVTGWEQTLLIEINYRIEQRVFNGDLLLLFPDRAIHSLIQRVDMLLAD